MKGNWKHDSQIQVEKVADFKGTGSQGRRRSPGRSTRTSRPQYADLVRRQPGRADEDPDREPRRRRRLTWVTASRRARAPAFAFVGFPDVPEGVLEPRRPAGALHGDQPQGDDRPDLPRVADAGDLVRVARRGRLPARTPAVRTANTTRPKAKQLYDAAGGPADIKITYNVDGGHKAWVDAMCNQIKASLGVNCTGQGEPKFADLLTKVREEGAGGPDPPRLGHGLPADGELPRPAVQHQRLVELLRLQQHGVRQPGQGGLRGGRPSRRPSRSGSRPRTSSPRTCR